MTDPAPATPELELEGGPVAPPTAGAGSPADVVALLRKVLAVMAAVDDVTPTGYNTQQGYAYASDDDLIRAIRPELISQGLIVLPSTQAVYTRTDPRYDRQTGQVTGTTEHARLDLTYTIIDTATGAAVPVTITGAGSDALDKAIAKAQTSGLKAFLRQTFLLADAEAEPGAQPAAARPSSAGAHGGAGDARPATEAQARMVYAKLKAAGIDDVEAALFAAAGKRDTRDLTRGDVDAILNRLAKGPPIVPGAQAAPPPASDVPAPDLEAEQARYAAQQAEAGGADVDDIPF